MVLVTQGSNAGHLAEIIGVTAKMYHIRRDDKIISKSRHDNVKLLETLERGRRATPEGLTTDTPRRNGRWARRHWTREQREALMMESIAEIQRHTTIVAECAEALQRMNMAENDD